MKKYTGNTQGVKDQKLIKDYTHRSGFASILLKKSPLRGSNELSNLLITMSVSTLKYCVYEQILKTPCQVFVGGGPPPSAKHAREVNACQGNILKKKVFHYLDLPNFELKIKPYGQVAVDNKSLDKNLQLSRC